MASILIAMASNLLGMASILIEALLAKQGAGFGLSLGLCKEVALLQWCDDVPSQSRCNCVSMLSLLNVAPKRSDSKGFSISDLGTNPPTF